MNEAQLIKAVIAHNAKGDQSKDKSEQHYYAAGEHLKTLKNDGAHKHHDMTWDAFVEKFCGIGKSRAHELIQIADGRKSLQDLRSESVKRVTKHRAKAPLRNGTNSTTQSTDEVLTVEDELEPSEYREAFLMRTADAMAFAVYSGDVDNEVLAAAKRVVTKWQELIQTMEENGNG